MKVNSNFFRLTSKKRLVSLSCATVLASFALIARPAFAEEVTTDKPTNLDTTTVTTATVETTADLVETHSSSTVGLSETSTASTTENISSNSTETANSLLATSEATSDLASQAGSQSQAASESPNTTSTTASTSTVTSTATSEANSSTPATSSETNITGGEYYLGDYGRWHYRDANGKDLVGPQTVDGIKVYFYKTGAQARGEFAGDRKYYDNEKGALVTNSYVTYKDDTYYIDENGYALKGPQVINGVHVYFNDKWQLGSIGAMLKNDFGKDNRYYNEKGEQVDFGKNNYFQIGEDWYYAGSDGAIVKGPQTIDGKKVYFEKESGKQVRNHFVKDATNPKKLYYYGDDNGALVTNQYLVAYNKQTQRKERYYLNAEGTPSLGEQTIEGKQVYFDPQDGRQLFDVFSSTSHYYDQDGILKDFGTNHYVNIKGNWYYVGSDGAFVKGRKVINGAQVYFDKDGKQVKGDFDDDNNFHDINDGDLVTNRLVTVGDKSYYIGTYNKAIKGANVIDGIEYYFDNTTGVQVKGHFASNGKYYDARSGAPVTNSYVQVGQDWYYVDKEGKAVTGEHTINGDRVYFNENRNSFESHRGKQVKGNFAENGRYYDQHTGALTDLGTNRYVQVNDDWYYIGSTGAILKGQQTIDGVEVYFDKTTGKQAKGVFINEYGNTENPNYGLSTVKFYDKDTGTLLKQQYFNFNDNWYYADADGIILKGAHTIDGVDVYFDKSNGKQVKGKFVTESGYVGDKGIHYYDKDTGALIKGGYFTDGGYWYYADDQGNLLSGEHTINGTKVYFNPKTHRQARGTIVNGYYYDKEIGAPHAVPRNQFIDIDDGLYYFDSEGKPLTGKQIIDGKEYYFRENGSARRGDFDYFGTGTYYDKKTGVAVYKAGLVEVGNGQWCYIDDKGKQLLYLQNIDGKLYYFEKFKSIFSASGFLVKDRLLSPETEEYNRHWTTNSTEVVKSEPYAYYYFDADTGAAVTNQFINWRGNAYYFGADGKALVFDQIIDGKHYYFDEQGKQVKGQFILDYNGKRYFDENTGELLTNTIRTINGKTYSFDKNGKSTEI